MAKSMLHKFGAGFASVALATSLVPVAAGTAMASDSYWSLPTQAVSIDYSSMLKTYGVRAGSAGPDFLGISNTNYDFTAAGAHSATQYTAYTAEDLQGVKGAGLAIWATSVNENPNPFYANLAYNAANPESQATAATTWSGNPDTSSWGDSIGSESVDVNGKTTIAGLEYQPEIIFGANKKTGWDNFDYTSTTIYQYLHSSQSGDATTQGMGEASTYDPTFTVNDSTNMWTQIYTLNQLAVTAESLKAESGQTTRYDDNNAIEGSLSYEKSIRGNLLYCASQIDNGAAKKKVAYLYAIDNGTGYFFVPTADGLLTGDDTGKTSSSSATTPDSNYAGNNGTINLDYMGVLPFITDTFDSGTELEGGIVMKVEDIFKTNPACTVGSSDTDILADVDVIIYNSTVNTNLDGTSGGKNSSGVNNTTALSDSVVSAWAEQHGFDTSKQIIAGDDFGTSNQQGYGTVAATESGMSPLLYCQRNYTTDKNARTAWAFSKVYPEFYPNEDASYSYWVDKVYHVNTENVGTVAAYMTNQSDEVVYDADIAAAMEKNFAAGIDWWENHGSKSEAWSQYAYYNGSSRSSYYDGNTESEEAENAIGIFQPSLQWLQNASSTQLTSWSRLSGETRYDTMSAIAQQSFTSADTVVLASGRNFPDALAASSLAGAYDSPLLLTDPAALSDQAADEIKELGAKSVVIVGGEGAVSDDVVQSLENLGLEVSRVYGETRYDTANQIAAATAKQAGVQSKTAIIASGVSFADALSISPYAYATKSPIFLADDKGTLSESTVKAIKDAGYTDFVFVGGDGRISDEVADQLGVSIKDVNRLFGQTRYETSLAVAEFCVDAGLSYDGAAVATGADFADALAGGAFCGHEGSVLLLAGNDEDSFASASEALSQHKYVIDNAYVLGGDGVISDATYELLETTTTTFPADQQ